jgi:PKHD-type hydroxylase
MEYGWHVDSPIMGNSNATIRVDMSITVFLSKPDEYDGGELEIDTEAGAQLFKLNKGDAIIYPTTRLHRVRSVTKGMRQVAVSWIQSFIKDTAQRDILFQLKSLQQALEQQQMGSSLHLLSQQIHSNLLRMLTEV